MRRHGDPPSSGVGVAQVSWGQVEGLFWQAAHASLGLLASGSLKLQERTFQETPFTKPSCDTHHQANRPQTSCVKLPCAPHPSPPKPPTPPHMDTQRHSSTKKHTSALDETRLDRLKHTAGSRENTRSTSHIVCGDPQLVHPQWSPSVAPVQLNPPSVHPPLVVVVVACVFGGRFRVHSSHQTSSSWEGM